MRDRVERRLAAIMATDIVGYSRLIETDELGALSAMKQLHREVIDPLVDEYNGRVMKVMGDGTLVEFASAVDAVACAAAIQKKVLRHQINVSVDRRITLRIGVNLGDVVVDGSDLLGDGVNVAARLEQLCKPGGVLISGTVFDQLSGKLTLQADDAGEHHVKNISRPIRAYNVRLGKRRTTTQHRAVLMAIAGVTLLILTGGVWWRVPTGPPAPVSLVDVLPFRANPADLPASLFAEGITEEIAENLTQFKALAVPTSNSLNRTSISAEHRYAVVGSVQRGAQIRVNAHLQRGFADLPLWSDYWEQPASSYSAVQKRIAGHIARQVAGQAYFMSGRYADALPLMESEPIDSLSRVGLAVRASLYAGLNRQSEARSAVAEAMSRYSDLSIEQIINENWSASERRRIITDMRIAGFPPCASFVEIAVFSNPATLPECPPLKQIDRAIAQPDCARVSARVLSSQGLVSLSGHLETHQVRSDLLSRISKLQGVERVDAADLHILGATYCDVLLFFQRHRFSWAIDSPGTGTFGELAHSFIMFRESPIASLIIERLPRAGVVYVDYFAADGTVHHLQQRVTEQLRPGNGEESAIPFADAEGKPIQGTSGMEVLVVIVASKPLFESLRRPVERSDQYLYSLGLTVERLQSEDPDFKIGYKYFLVDTAFPKEEIIPISEGASLRKILIGAGATEQQAAAIQSAFVSNFTFSFHAGQRLGVLVDEYAPPEFRLVRISLYEGNTRHAVLALDEGGMYVPDHPGGRRDVYEAFSVSEQEGAYGRSGRLSSRGTAEAVAVSKCRRIGGADCRIVTSFSGKGCFALALIPGEQWGVAQGADLIVTKENSFELCERTSTAPCWVVAASCG